jgi:hypothetical protein
MVVDDGGLREKRVPVNYPANSKKSKTEPATTDRPKQEKIIEGAVTRRKSGGFFGKVGLTSETSSSVGQFILMEVLVPAAKNMAFDAISAITDSISAGVEHSLFGTSRRSRGGSVRPGGQNYTSYSRPSVPVRGAADNVRTISPRARSRHSFDEVVFADRGEAEEVLGRLRDVIREFGTASVGDLYDLIGATGNFTDNAWGWTDLRDARTRQVRQGYLLVLPSTEQID